MKVFELKAPTSSGSTCATGVTNTSRWKAILSTGPRFGWRIFLGEMQRWIKYLDDLEVWSSYIGSVVLEPLG